MDNQVGLRRGKGQYLDDMWFKRSWGGEVKNVAVLIAAGVDLDRAIGRFYRIVEIYYRGLHHMPKEFQQRRS